MNKDKVYLKGYVVGRAVDTLGYQGLMVQLENLDIVEIDKNLVHKEIDEPQKPVVKQFVADWYEKNNDSFDYNLWEYLTSWEEQEPSDFKNWINDKYDAFQTLVNMHQFGYEVEEEKRYYVRLKGVDENYNYFSCIKHLDAWCLTELKTDKKFRTTHTRKQLEDADFGWVFDCEGIEIEEVE